ncbi:MAG TPA: mechanosensitive ion channel domain-containing protein [Burkholderiales bacterium]|nr:mechanosensitive ion channel domain-containing protein [Burkholderiales bacterium]
MDEQLESVAQVKNTLIDLSIRFGPKLLVALIILSVGFFVGRWLGAMTDRMLERLRLDVPVRQLLVRIVRILVLGLFLIMALQNLGVELLPLIAGIGIAGAGIALAMQGVLSNVAAGLTIIFTRPFRVGEYVSMAGEEGQVAVIGLFSTTLTHPDLSRVVIPNRKIVGEILHNYGTIRQIDIMVGVSYGTDLNRALGVVQDLLRNNPRVLKEPAPMIQVLMLGDSSVNIGVKPWVNVSDYGDAFGEINKGIVETFHARGIVIPFPQREVRLLGGSA